MQFHATMVPRIAHGLVGVQPRFPHQPSSGVKRSHAEITEPVGTAEPLVPMGFTERVARFDSKESLDDPDVTVSKVMTIDL